MSYETQPNQNDVRRIVRTYKIEGYMAAVRAANSILGGSDSHTRQAFYNAVVRECGCKKMNLTS